MATSQAFASPVTVDDVIIEAFELIGFDPSSVTSRHIISAKRSLNILLRSWNGIKDAVFKTSQYTQTLVSGTKTYNLPAGAYDVLTCVYRDQDNYDVPLVAMSRSDYTQLPVKSEQSSRPTQYFVDHQQTATITLWPVPTDPLGSIVFDYVRYAYEAQDLAEDVDVVNRWEEAMHYGLASKLALKFKEEKYSLLKSEYGAALKLAIMADRDRSDTYFKIGGR